MVEIYVWVCMGWSLNLVGQLLDMFICYIIFSLFLYCGAHLNLLYFLSLALLATTRFWIAHILIFFIAANLKERKPIFNFYFLAKILIEIKYIV